MPIKNDLSLGIQLQKLYHEEQNNKKADTHVSFFTHVSHSHDAFLEAQGNNQNADVAHQQRSIQFVGNNDGVHTFDAVFSLCE